MSNAVREFYNNIANVYDELYGNEQIKKLDKIEIELKKIIRNNKFKTGIDIGCGTGLSTVYLKKFCRRIDAIDLSENMIKIARRRVKVKFYRKDLLKTFFTKKYSLVFCITVLQDLKSPTAGLRKLRRLCNGRSIVVISVLKHKGYLFWKKKIIKHFKVLKEIFDEKDFIFICKPK